MSKMNSHVILLSCLCGSFFIFTTSLVLTNKALLEDKKIPKELYVVNGLTMFGSGYVVIYTFSLLNLHALRFLKF